MIDFDDPRDLDRLYDALDQAEEKERVRLQDFDLHCDHCDQPLDVGRAIFTNKRFVLCDECFWKAVEEYRAQHKRFKNNRYKEASCQGTL